MRLKGRPCWNAESGVLSHAVQTVHSEGAESRLGWQVSPGDASPDRMPFALYHLVDPEAMDIDLLAPLAEPAGSCLGSGEVSEERHKGMTDTALAAGLMLQVGVAAGLQEGETVDCVAIEVQACTAAETRETQFSAVGVVLA